MADIYSDENVDIGIVLSLRALGHDVLRVYEDGRANQKIGDPDVLARAVELGRCVLTNNRQHFHRLHRIVPDHQGIITYTDDSDSNALASRIHTRIVLYTTLAGQLIRIVKPNPSTKPPHVQP